MVVGLIEPSQLEKDIIYVTLKKNKPEEIFMNITSNDYFKNLDYKAKYLNARVSSNDKAYETYLTNFADYNNAEVIYNLEDDAFKIQRELNYYKGKIENIKHLVR